MSSRIIVALDYAKQQQAIELVEQLSPQLCRLKIGKEMFTRFGPSLVTDLSKRGFDVFLDLKFHDIPNTVAQACLAAADLGVWMINVHASGGRAMLEAAANRLAALSSSPLLVGVTVLTSMDETGLHEVGVDSSPQQQVLRLAKLAEQCGLEGVVCSPQELIALQSTVSETFLRVTPGVRSARDALNDQKRVASPATAIQDGASHLVIGRPITQADDPHGKLLTLLSECGD